MLYMITIYIYYTPRCARQFCKSKIFSALRALEARENV